MSRPSRGRKIREAFFTRIHSTGYEWECRCGKRRKLNGTGFTNLVSHVQSQHPEELKVLIDNNMEVEKNASERSSVRGTPKSLFIHARLVVLLGGWI